MRVRIEHFDRTLDVGDLQTILEAALDAGIDYPFACQQGQCGACKSLLLEGEVDMGSLYNPLVCTPLERARGLVLACQSLPLADCVVAPLEVGGELRFPVRTLDCTVTEVLAAGIACLRIDAGKPFHFAAGQYARVRLGEPRPLALPMAGCPDDDELAFQLEASPGDHVSVTGPFGDAYLREEHLGPMLVVAADSGLAAARSLLATAVARGMVQPIHAILVGAAALEADLRQSCGGHANIRLTSCDATDLTAAIMRGLESPAGYRAYVFGPTKVCTAAAAALLATGLAPAMICIESFTLECVPT